MKTFQATAAALAVAAALAPSAVVGHESMLEAAVGGSGAGGGGEGGDAPLRRRLLWFSQDYWESIYYRCCALDVGEGTESLNNDAWRAPGWNDSYGDFCRCPKRGSGSTGWFSSKSYYEKWEESCSPDGTIYRKAGITE